MEPEQIMDKIAGLIKKYLSSQKQNSFLHYKDPSELREILKLNEYKDGAEWSRIFAWIEKYLTYSVKTNHAGSDLTREDIDRYFLNFIKTGKILSEKY